MTRSIAKAARPARLATDPTLLFLAAIASFVNLAINREGAH